MKKITILLTAVLIIALAGYAYSLHKQLQEAAAKYDSAAMEINRKLSLLHEDKLKAQEDAARQRAELEKVKAEAESLKTKTVEVSAAQASSAAAQVTTAVKVAACDTRSQAKLAKELAAKEKAAKLKAEVESLMDESGKIRNVWEERGARL